MNFKELKAGYPIYVFDRSAVELNQYKINNISDPHFDSNIDNMNSVNFKAMQPPEMVVDVSIDMGGFTKQFVLKEGTEIGYAGTLVLSTSKERVLQEVEILKNQSQLIIQQYDKCKQDIAKCDSIIAEYNPHIKEKQETDKRFEKLESLVSKMEKKLTKFLDNIDKEHE